MTTPNRNMDSTPSSVTAGREVSLTVYGKNGRKTSVGATEGTEAGARLVLKKKLGIMQDRTVDR